MANFDDTERNPSGVQPKSGFFFFKKNILLEFFVCTLILFLFLCIFMPLVNIFIVWAISGVIIFLLQWWRHAKPLKLKAVPVDLVKEYSISKRWFLSIMIFLYGTATLILILIIHWVVVEKSKDNFDLLGMGIMLFLGGICASFGYMIQKYYLRVFSTFEVFKQHMISDRFGHFDDN